MGKKSEKTGLLLRLNRAIGRWTDSQFDSGCEYYEDGVSVVMDFICHGRNRTKPAGNKKPYYPSGYREA